MATSQCRTQVNESELRELTYELPIGENSVRHQRWIYKLRKPKGDKMNYQNI